MTSDSLEQLAGLEIACRFLFTALHQPPSDDFLQQLTSEELLHHWPVESDGQALINALTLMNRFLAAREGHKVAQIKEDFNALFIGPHELKAVPWSSVYLTEEQLVMTEPAMAVRSFYRHYGVEIHTGEHEPDDHIGLQFAFMAHLIGRALDAVEQDQAYEPWVEAIGEFLTHHVLTWSGRFLEVMETGAETDFYKGLAQLTGLTLKQLAEVSGAEYRIVRLYR